MTQRILILVVLLATAGCASAPTTPEYEIFGILEGAWDEVDPATCQASRVISFSDDWKTLIATFPDGAYFDEDDIRDQLRYRIHDVTESEIRAAMEDETRLDPDGNPVVWRLRLIDSRTFCWGRDDWPENYCTPPRYKCDS